MNHMPVVVVPSIPRTRCRGGLPRSCHGSGTPLPALTYRRLRAAEKELSVTHYLEQAAASQPQSRSWPWAIQRGPCRLSGWRSSILRTGHASLVDPGNWFLSLETSTGSGNGGSDFRGSRWLLEAALTDLVCRVAPRPIPEHAGCHEL